MIASSKLGEISNIPAPDRVQRQNATALPRPLSIPLVGEECLCVFLKQLTAADSTILLVKL